jgi:hypothetical protein
LDGSLLFPVSGETGERGNIFSLSLSGERGRKGLIASLERRTKARSQILRSDIWAENFLNKSFYINLPSQSTSLSFSN